MGAAASVSQEEVSKMPQYTILGGESKFAELKGEDGNVDRTKFEDPYLKYGGSYAGDIKDSADFKYVTFEELPKFTEAHKSGMAKHLTQEVFDKLKDVKSEKGYTLSNSIMTGVVTPHLGVGCTAGDEDCWEKFKDLYYPIIKDWHGYDANTQKHPVDLDFSKVVFTDEQKATFGKYVASTRIRAARNISGFSLPTGATDEDRAGVETVLKQAFAGLKDDLSGTYYELGGLSDEQRDFLLERGFLFQIPSARNLLTGAGAARSWPNNRGIFHNETQTVLAWVNEEDHCRIISMDLGGDIPSVFKRFCQISDALKVSAESNGTKLMWNETLGFLGTCPSNLGTGLRASVMVCLPEFNKLLEGDNQTHKELLEEVCSAFQLQPRGSAGEHSAAVGAKFDVSNKQRLGYSEVELVQKMIDGVTKVIEYEEKLAGGMAPDAVRAELQAAGLIPGAPAAAPAAAAGPTEDDKKLVEESWELVKGVGLEAVGVLLFKNMFEETPAVLPLFSFGQVEDLYESPKLKAHGMNVVTHVGMAVANLRDLEKLGPILKGLGKKHVAYKVVPDYFPLVGAALLKTLTMGLGDKATPEVLAAWSKTYDLIAQYMIEGLLE